MEPKVVAKTSPAPYCTLPALNVRRAFVPSHNTDIAKTFREFAPIFVSEVKKCKS